MRLSHLFVRVSNLERTRAWYVDLLGLEVLVDEPEYLRVGGGGGFAIGFEAGPPGEVGAVGIEVVVEVDDVDRRYEELVAAGARADEPPGDQEWGARHAWLRDPDGYRVSIFSAMGQGT